MAEDPERDFKNVWSWLIGRKTGAEPGSNLRRLWSRLSLFAVACLFVEALIGRVTSQLGLSIMSYGALFWAAAFFLTVVFFQPLRSSNAFSVDAQRLLIDTLISAAMMIMAFSAVFRLHGLVPPDHLGMDDVIAAHAVYFSAVTFSTLGFGDFTPYGASQPFAAVEALVGNIHLGFVVGSIFVIVGRFNR